jgi:hypothetical protein
MTVGRPRLRIAFDGTNFVDVTDRLLNRDPVTIRRGRSPEASQTDPSEMTFTLRNDDGALSPKNPNGPYYGLLGRNSAVSYAVEVEPRLSVLSTADGFVTVDHASLDITGDLELHCEFSGGMGGRLVGKDGSYLLGLTEQGIPYVSWLSPAGAKVLVADAPLPTHGRQVLAVALDVSFGGNHRAAFYTADSWDGTPVQLGSIITGSGTTSIVANSGIGIVGFSYRRDIFRAAIVSGIGGTVVAEPDFTIQTEGATSFVDSTGKTWVPYNGAAAVISATVPRFVGYLTGNEADWDTAEACVTAQMTASGVLRRLAQGAAPLGSALRDELPNAESLIAYWPMEDGPEADSLAAATPGTQAAILDRVQVTPGASEPFLASGPLPQSTNQKVYGSGITARPGGYTSSGSVTARFLIRVPDTFATEEDSAAYVFAINSGGTLSRLELIWGSSVGSGGGSIILGWDRRDELIFDSIFLLDDGLDEFAGQNVMMSFEIFQVGGDLELTFRVMREGDDSHTFWEFGPIAGRTLGKVESIELLPRGLTITNPDSFLAQEAITVGHLTFANPAVPEDFDLLAPALAAYDGEDAADRVYRIAVQEDLFLGIYGLDGPSEPLGPQPKQATALEILQEAELADGGILYESREFFGLVYRTRESAYSQSPHVVMSYGQFDPGLKPIEDDLLTRNDVTVTRAGGSSGRKIVESGPMSVQDPPDGVGRYSDSLDLSLFSDSQAQAQAEWRAHLGTNDEPRFPTIPVVLHRPSVADGANFLVDNVWTLDLLDVVQITDTPAWFPPEDTLQIVSQVTERITVETWEISFSGSPARRYRVGVVGNEYGRMDSSDTVTAEALDTTETGVDVTGSTIWITTATKPARFPFLIDIGGEVMRVTAATGTTAAAQTFTVVRSVNGIVKSHLAGAEVHLADQSYYGL